MPRSHLRLDGGGPPITLTSELRPLMPADGARGRRRRRRGREAKGSVEVADVAEAAGLDDVCCVNAEAVEAIA